VIKLAYLKRNCRAQALSSWSRCDDYFDLGRRTISLVA
jgi:hypothetical protein